MSYHYRKGMYYESWFLNDKWHRLDGPAYTQYNKDGTLKVQFWAVNDKKYTKENWEAHPDVIEYRLNKLINQELSSI